MAFLSRILRQHHLLVLCPHRHGLWQIGNRPRVLKVVLSYQYGLALVRWSLEGDLQRRAGREVVSLELLDLVSDSDLSAPGDGPARPGLLYDC